MIGFVFVLLGLAFFLEGLNLALFPLGKLMASQLTAPEFLGVTAGALQTVDWQNYLWVYLFAAAIGWSIVSASEAPARRAASTTTDTVVDSIR